MKVRSPTSQPRGTPRYRRPSLLGVPVSVFGHLYPNHTAISAREGPRRPMGAEMCSLGAGDREWFSRWPGEKSLHRHLILL